MDNFHIVSARLAKLCGHPMMFVLAAVCTGSWAAAGRFLGFSDSWLLIANTSTTVVTFVLVFLIQNARRRHSDTMHLKLNELLRAMEEARTDFADLEDRSEEEVERLRVRYTQLAAQTKERLAGR
jgi:low affinity Fe/Cu permease